MGTTVPLQVLCFHCRDSWNVSWVQLLPFHSTISLFNALVCPSLHDLSRFLAGWPASSFFIYFILYHATKLVFLKYSFLIQPVFMSTCYGQGSASYWGYSENRDKFHDFLSLGRPVIQCDYSDNYLVIATWPYDLEQVAWPFCLRFIICGTGITVALSRRVVLFRGSNRESAYRDESWSLDSSVWCSQWPVYLSSFVCSSPPQPHRPFSFTQTTLLVPCLWSFLLAPSLLLLLSLVIHTTAPP